MIDALIPDALQYEPNGQGMGAVNELAEQTKLTGQIYGAELPAGQYVPGRHA